MLSLERRIEVAGDEAEHTKLELLRRITHLRHDLENEQRRIESGKTPCGLGVVQGTGSQIDLLCAVYVDRMDRLRKLQTEQEKETQS